MGAVDPGEEAYRAGLEQARNAETQAPPRTVWPLICHQHAQLTRHRDDLLQASSRADIRAAEQDTVTARTTRQEIRAEQTAREEHLATRVAHLRHRSQALQAVGRNDLVCQGLSHGYVTEERYDQIVIRRRELVELQTRSQCEFGDLALEIEPLQPPHGGAHPNQGEALFGVPEPLQLTPTSWPPHSA